jgi:hypothetical protein
MLFGQAVADLSLIRKHEIVDPKSKLKAALFAQNLRRLWHSGGTPSLNCRW